MSVSDSISGALRRFGRQMVLRRYSLGPNGVQVPLDVTVYGRSKGYTASNLVASVMQGDTEITITNAEISAAQWPGPPKKDDRFIFDGRIAVLQANPEPKYLGTEVLVYVCHTRG